VSDGAASDGAASDGAVSDASLIDAAKIDAAAGNDAAPEEPQGGPPPLVVPPANADGNCKGRCTGLCSSGANGFCAGAPCLSFPPGGGPPSLASFDGWCPDRCAGACRSGNGSGASATCNGECTANKKQCDGRCVGECGGNRTNPVCLGSLRCGQNTECENACQAAALLKTVCSAPKKVEVYAVADVALQQAFTKHGAKLGKAVTALPYIRDSLQYVGARAYGDFVAVGLSGDLVKACVKKGNDNVTAARTKFTAAVAANPSVRKLQTQNP
jgi:hypothetical protein